MDDELQAAYARQREETRRLLREDLAKELRDRADLLPPWLKYPDIERYAIGWRMGAGEWYMMLWGEWAERLAPPERLAYWHGYAPIPPAWVDWVAATFGYDDIERREGEAGVFTGARWLAEQGLASFDEFKAWFDAEWSDIDDETEDLDLHRAPGGDGPEV